MLQQQEQEFAAANEALLAGFMDRINSIADMVEQNSRADHSDCAAQLRLATEDLKMVRGFLGAHFHSSMSLSASFFLLAIKASLKPSLIC